MAEALDPAISTQIDDLARAVLEAAYDRGVSLATAESCTGGLLASLLTDIPGCSHAFERGFVTYTDAAKREMLGVAADVLADDGAVSEAAARAMAEGAILRSQAGAAVSITGYAEAEPGTDQEAGLVHFACARRGGETIHAVHRFGNVGRAEVRLKCLETSLRMLRTALRA